jgi:hypothetical protein
LTPHVTIVRGTALQRKRAQAEGARGFSGLGWLSGFGGLGGGWGGRGGGASNEEQFWTRAMEAKVRCGTGRGHAPLWI